MASGQYADFISASTNRYTGVWMAAPALVQLEANVLDWLRDWMSFPPTTRGLLTTGGSMAAFNAILCAREAGCVLEAPGGGELDFPLEGKTVVLQANKELTPLAENALEGPVFASPALAGSAIYLRTDSHLYCLQQLDK